MRVRARVRVRASHFLEVSPLSLHTHRSDGQLGGPPILVSLQLFLHHSVVPPAGP